MDTNHSMTEHNDDDAWIMAGSLARMAIYKAKSKAAKRQSVFDMERFLTDFFVRKQEMQMTDARAAELMAVSQLSISKYRRRAYAQSLPMLLRMAELAQLNLWDYRGGRP